MDARLDSSFESWGLFTEKLADRPNTPGRLSYSPEKGVELELVPTAGAVDPDSLLSMRSAPKLYGQLVDGTLVTLVDCFITSVGLGAGGIGLPTVLVANRMLLGAHIDDLDHTKTKWYSVEFSSLANWTCTSPPEWSIASDDGSPMGVDLRYRWPEPIHVPAGDSGFDLKISHGWQTFSASGSLGIRWHAHIAIEAHDTMVLRDANEAAWQCQNLLSLFIGHPVSMKSIAIKPASADPRSATEHPLTLIFQQRGKHDQPDLYPPQMLLPYASVKDDFPQIVRRWFGRSEQQVLAANVFFGSQLLESPVVNVKFLAVMQAAESYHRALGTGVYSLRKRLTSMLDRIPEDARRRIAGDVPRFVAKVVDTRNYYTHYDSASRANVFDGRGAFIASERLRVLVVANLLHDLGIPDESLLSVLERSREYQHWLSQDLPL